MRCEEVDLGIAEVGNHCTFLEVELEVAEAGKTFELTFELRLLRELVLFFHSKEQLEEEVAVAANERLSIPLPPLLELKLDASWNSIVRN